MVPFWSDWAAFVDRFAPTLLDAGIRSLVILALAGVVATALRRGSAAARHWVWLLAFAGLLLLPVLTGTLPTWRVLPWVVARGAADQATTVVIEAPPEVVPGLAPRAGGSNDAGSAEVSNESPVAAKTDRPAVKSAPTTPEPAAAAAAVLPVQKTTTGANHIGLAALPWTLWVVLAWAAGGLVVLGHVLLGHASLWRLQRRCTRVTQGEWLVLLEKLRQEMGVERKVKLLSTPARTMPMTWGLWHARLLLPAHAAEWPAEQRRAVLLHELGHVRRWDCVTQLLAQLACAGYWFNPAVWVAWRRMQMEREKACDDRVLATGARASAYARHLVDSATAVAPLRFVSAAALAMARPSRLEERVRAILDGRRNRRGLTGGVVLATMVLLAVVLVPVAVLRAQEAPGRGPDPAAAVLPPGYAARAAASRPEATAAATSPTARGGARGGGARGGLGAASGAQVPRAALGEGPTCSMDGTIYELRVPPDQIGRMDADALTRAAATPADFEKALAGLGTMRPLYRVNQSVRIAGDYIQIGSQVPYVSNTQMTANGTAVNSVSYASVGAIFEIRGKTSENGRIELDMQIQIATLTEGATTIATGVKAPIFRVVQVPRKGMVEQRKPFVVVSGDAAVTDANGKAMVYVARIMLGELQSPAATASAPASVTGR